MTFSELREGVRQAWEFVLPPISNLFVLLALTYYVAPALLPRVLGALPLLDIANLIDPQLRKALEDYGIVQFIPVFAAVGVIFVLYLVQAFVLWLGYVLPGSIVVFEESRLMQVASPSKFADFWAAAAETRTASEAASALLDVF